MIATLALLDGCAILVALCAATFGWHRPLTGDWAADSRALALLLTLTLGTLIALYYADAYDLQAVPGPGPFIARLPRCVAFAAVPLGAAYVFAPNAVAPAAMVIVAALVALPVLRSPFYTLVHRGVFAERVLVIGTGPLARRALEAAEDRGLGRCVIVGVVVDDEMDADDVFVSPHERLGPLSRLDRIIQTTEPDRIVMALAERRRRLPIPPLLEARLRGIMIEDAAVFYERLTGKIAIEALTPSSLIFSQDFRVPRLALCLGRALSLGVALVGLVVLAPAIGAIAECNTLGIAVPQRVSITGFDDMEIASLLSPGLTTVHFPTLELGQLAAANLLAQLAGTSAARQHELPVELKVRGTTAPPARAQLRRAR